MTNFSCVLLTDGLSWQIYCAAAQEKLLFTRSSTERLPQVRQTLARQRALALLVLFDKILLDDRSQGEFRLPDLENDGIVQVLPPFEPNLSVRPVRSSWQKGPLKRRGKPPRSLLQSLRIIEEEKPLVVERLAAIPTEFDREMARVFRISRRDYVEAVLDYASALVKGDTGTMGRSLFKLLPRDFRKEIEDEMFDFHRYGDRFSPINALLVGSIIVAREIRTAKNLSAKLRVGVASEHYGDRLQSATAGVNHGVPPNAVANSFLTIRVALAEERGVLPQIEGIRHALALRKDPNLKGLREHLHSLNASIQKGKVDDLIRVRDEIARARKILKQKRRWEKALNWLTYLSVPLLVAETLAGAPPIASLTVSTLGLTGEVANQRAEKANEWVLFGL